MWIRICYKDDDNIDSELFFGKFFFYTHNLCTKNKLTKIEKN